MTAQEFMDQEKYDYDLITTSDYFYGGGVAKHFEKIMIEFAKYHVNQALSETLKWAEIQEYLNKDGKWTSFVVPNSILNAYPLSQIK